MVTTTLKTHNHLWWHTETQSVKASEILMWHATVKQNAWNPVRQSRHRLVLKQCHNWGGKSNGIICHQALKISCRSSECVSTALATAVHFLKAIFFRRLMFSFRSGTLTSVLPPGHNTNTFTRVDCSGSREIMSSMLRSASTFSLALLSKWQPSDFLALIFLVVFAGLSLVLEIFFCPGLLSGVETEVGKLRFVLGRTSISSGSLCVINFGFTTFSTLAINLKVSLVFRIFVAHGLQTRSDKEGFLSALSPVDCSAHDRTVPSRPFLPDGRNKFSDEQDFQVSP